MKSKILLSFALLITLTSVLGQGAESNPYKRFYTDNNLSYSESEKQGYYDNIPKRGVFKFLGVEGAGDINILFFKTPNNKVIQFIHSVSAAQKKYKFYVDKNLVGKSYNITWDKSDGRTLLSAVYVPTKPTSSLTNGQSASALKMQYLYASNAGLYVFYTNGSYNFCPRCDFTKSNVSGMEKVKGKADGTYKVGSKGLTTYSKGNTDEFSFYTDDDAKELDDSWALFDNKWRNKP